MVRIGRLWAIAIVMAVVGGCTVDFARIIDNPDAQATFDTVVEGVLARDPDMIEPVLHETVSRDGLRSFLETYSEIIPDPSASAEITWANVTRASGTGGQSATYSVAYILDDGTKAARLGIRTVTVDGVCCKVDYLEIFEAAPGTGVLAPFSFEGAGILHYGVLALAVGLPIFCLVTAVAVVRAKGLRRKWLWVPFVLIGVGSLTFDWGSGAIGTDIVSISENGFFFKLLDLHLLASGLAGTDDWRFTLAFPLGAVLFWAGREERRRQLADATGAEAETDEQPVS